MTYGISPRWRWVGMAALLPAALLLTSCQQCGTIGGLCGSETDGCAEKAKVCAKPTVRALAADLDELEKHIDRCGSVVADQPSVWGQARLTKHRQEFEQQMEGQLSKFEATLQGSLSRSDQAYVADAVALQYTAQAAASKPASKSPFCAAPAPAASASSSSSPPPAGIVLSPDLQGTFGAFDNITRNPARLANPIGFASIGQNGLSLEPTVFLDQMKRYLDHLNELRRINEGDDTADSPGYSLNLVRIPISVLPGRKTDEGYGAEITLTLKSHLHDELLPMTFRNLVTNDLMEQIGVPLTQLMNDMSGRAFLYEQIGDDIKSKNNETPSPQPAICTGDEEKYVKSRLQTPETRALMELVLSQDPNPSYHDICTGYHLLLEFIKKNPIQTSSAVLVASPRRRAQRPFPVSQITEVYGTEEFIELAKQTYKICGTDVPNKDVVHYSDVQSFLQDELAAAYRFLQDPSNVDLWQHCDESLASAIRSQRVQDVIAKRMAFQQDVLLRTQKSPIKEITLILAWAVLVDSALLNDQLVEDMKNAASARGAVHLPTEWLPYFLPCPPAETRQAFNEYVNCRWPIHVFALDPAADQQNIADTFSSRREMQLAMSLSFMSGQLSANNLLRYARRLETEVETISLNNTAVGFSHGAETFGWRFYPRFQTPDTEGNVTVFFRDLLIGGPNRNALLRQNRLEPGVRECVAIVLMPSFVPYADLTSSSNFFRLDNPECKVMDAVDAVQLSARVKSIQNCAPRVENGSCYRDGELEGLLLRAEQLESRLPRQTMSVQVPYENTLGGFAMFNTGVTDLAPELLGWYGAPAVNLDGPTTLFLIGNHFSVHQTRVLAGGQEITNPELLSRQVMKVTIPAGALALVEQTGFVAGGYKIPIPSVTAAKNPSGGQAPAMLVPAPCPNTVPGATVAAPSEPAPNAPAGTTTVTMSDDKSVARLGPDYLFVDIQLATPYGVSAHLLVPAWRLGKPGADASGAGAGADASGAGAGAASALPEWATKELTLGFVYQGCGITPAAAPSYQPKELAINMGAQYALEGGAKLTLKMKLGGGAKGALPDMDVLVTSTNYDPKTHILKITDGDLAHLISLLFSEVQYQFGPEATKPPSAITIAETTVVAPGTPDTKLLTSLKVNWVKAAGPPTPTFNVLLAPPPACGPPRVCLPPPGAGAAGLAPPLMAHDPPEEIPAPPAGPGESVLPPPRPLPPPSGPTP